MSAIGTFYAKANLPRVMRRVQEGERFVIARHNRPVAEHIPIRDRDIARIRAAVDRLAVFQKTHNLQGLSGRELIEGGRRF